MTVCLVNRVELFGCFLFCFVFKSIILSTFVGRVIDDYRIRF